ncbi:hypothetical protein AB0953_28045 [Streptomyces sp. NPDC046866]|uniref:hypothetical protein n=1 Tax=Streptomyces sp. NPDC046866 TaxID=3154921 RepID=UPI0034543C37
MVPAPGAVAVGLLLTDLTSWEWAVLDAFEDVRYTLTPVTTSGGGRAWAYIWPAEDVRPEDWDADTFAELHLRAYAGLAPHLAARAAYAPSERIRRRSSLVPRERRQARASLALDIEKQAGQLAAQTVADLREQLARATGSLRALQEGQAQQRDTLILNTCRALSLQYGQPPYRSWEW